MSTGRREYNDKGSPTEICDFATVEIQQVEGQNLLPVVHFYPIGDEVGVTIYYISKPQPCPRFQFVQSLNGRGASWVFALPSGIVKIRMDKQ